MNLVIQAIKCATREKIVVVLIFHIVTRSNVFGSLSIEDASINVCLVAGRKSIVVVA